MPLRKIVKIDEDKCDGCGLCVPSCAEGAIQVIDGKARLVSEIYCDGLGACLGDCPRDAISIEEREAEEFDESAVEKHLDSFDKNRVQRAIEKHLGPVPSGHHGSGGGSCPGSLTMSLKDELKHAEKSDTKPITQSRPELANWPVQLALAPVNAQYFDNADLLISADCVPFSYPDFHSRYLKGRILLIACPKLDNTRMYLEKLSQIFTANSIRSIEVMIMEVPCCSGLVHLVREALVSAGGGIPASYTKVGLKGDIMERVVIEASETGKTG